MPRPALRSGYDQEIFLLFLPALVAGMLEPLQQSVESILVGKLGVSQASVVALMWVLHARIPQLPQSRKLRELGAAAAAHDVRTRATSGWACMHTQACMQQTTEDHVWARAA